MSEEWVTRRGQKTAHAVLFWDRKTCHTVCNKAGGQNMEPAAPTHRRCADCSRMLTQLAGERAGI